MKFYFGCSKNASDCVRIEAKNKEHAIKIFKVSELFPEKCVDIEYRKDYDYDSELRRNIYKFKDNPKISIHEINDVHKWKKVGEITLKECTDVDFRNLLPQANLLSAPDVQETSPEETLPIIFNADAVSKISSKTELRKKHDEIARRKAELETMVSELNSSMNVLKNELRQKQKVIYIIETYLGIHEEVELISDGKSAPDGCPLTLYQQKLFMDEEVGIWDDPDGQGIDCHNIKEFDKWIIKHYEKFVYEPLSIVIWQVRRKNKQYNDLWSNSHFNNLNKTTYFLIRNGEKLYRIWSDVSVGDRLFPTKDEYMKLISEEKKWGEEGARKKLQQKHEGYLYGLIAIQGTIERTDVLGAWLRQQGLNLLSPRGNVDKYVKFVRDAESEFWIGDGKPRWRDFLEENRSSVCLGSRICLATETFYFSLSGKDNDSWRCAPFHPCSSPNRDQCYIVESFKGESPKDTHFPYETKILIRYHSSDCVGWDPYTYVDKIRKRRVPWFLYSDEVINIDEISLEQADYYMKSRLDRENYVKMLPTLHWIRRVKLREKELEDEFAKMIVSQLNWEQNVVNKDKIQKAIIWWKLKNKWKRAITIKESTATRMIIKKLKGDKKNGNC